MKKQKVKKILYLVRCEIIEEISDHERDLNGCPGIDRGPGYEYGYDRGLTEAAMILLDRIYELFPEEKEESEA